MYLGYDSHQNKSTTQLKYLLSAVELGLDTTKV